MAFTLDDLPEAPQTPPAKAKLPEPDQLTIFHEGMNITPGQTPTATPGDSMTIMNGGNAPTPPRTFSIDQLPDAPVNVQATGTKSKAEPNPTASYHIDDLPEHHDEAPKQIPPEQDPGMFQKLASYILDKSNEGSKVADKTINPDLKKSLDEQVPFFPDSLHIQHSPVGQMMSLLSAPLRTETAALVKGLDVFSPGIQKKLNPDGSVIPDIAMNDVINYYGDKFFGTPQNVQDWVSTHTNSPLTGKATKALYWTARTGLGMAANVYADPLMLARLGVYNYTPEGLEAYKAGQSVGPEGRQAISMQLPLDRRRGIPAAPIVDAAQQAVTKARGVAEKIPGAKQSIAAVQGVVQGAGQLLRSLHPFTGNDQLDLARSAHKAIMRGDETYQSAFANTTNGLNLSDSELNVVNSLMESTPNLRPSFATDKMVKDYPKYGASEAEIRAMIKQRVQKEADRLGIRLDPGKAEAIEEGVVATKKYNNRTLERQVEFGHIDSKDAHKHVIENYLTHKLSPEAEAFRKSHPNNPELVSSFVEAQETQKLVRAVKGKTLMAYNPNQRARQIRNTLEEANAIMREKTGVTNWFQTNPFVAAMERNALSLKHARDKKLLDTISQYGYQPQNAAEKRRLMEAGWKPILHPEFDGKQVIIKKFNDEAYREAKGMAPDHVNQKQFTKTVKMNYHDVLFPGEVAEKISYDIIPRAMGTMTNINAYMDTYNRVFRTTTLLKPDYYLTNWTGNIVKNVVNGVKMEDWVDAANALLGKEGTTFTMIENGKRVEKPISELRALIDKWNVRSSHFNEDLEPSLYAAKKVTRESPGTFSREQGLEKVKQLMTTMNKVGARGENFTRIAMFVNRIKEGYTPERAAFEVEKFLFDFGRTTHNLDVTRRWMAPFIQHAIKTAAVAPELIGKAPGVWNAWHNSIPHTLQAAFNDPIQASAIAKIMPSYFKNQDRIAGPLFTGNVWLAANAQVDQDKQGGKQTFVTTLGLPGGMEIMNQFGFFFDSDIARQDTMAPVLRSIAILFAGKDPYDGKDIDVTKDFQPVKRLNWAVRQFVLGAVNFPAVSKIAAVKFGLKDSTYYEGASIALWNSMMGRFGKITNLDREFQFRIMHFAANEKALRSALASQIIKENTGRTADITLAKYPDLIRNQVGDFQNPDNSAGLMNRLQLNHIEANETNLAKKILSNNPPTAAEIANMIKNIQKSAHEANMTYQTSAKRYLEMANEQRNR